LAASDSRWAGPAQTLSGLKKRCWSPRILILPQALLRSAGNGGGLNRRDCHVSFGASEASLNYRRQGKPKTNAPTPTDFPETACLEVYLPGKTLRK
jgi:hypothetical protein